MRNIYLIIIFLTFISCNGQNKKSLSNYCCICISEIPTELSEQQLRTEIRKCFTDGYIKYADEIQKIMDNYFKEKPTADLASSKMHVRKVLTEHLIKNCPRYAKITSDLISKQRPISSGIIETVAKEICNEINELEVSKLSDKIVDPILMKVTMKYNNQIRKEYNLSNREEMQKYAYDLSYKLMADCEKYKIMGIQKQ